MINLISSSLWQNCEPFGTLPNNSLGVVSQYMTGFYDNSIQFYIEHKDTIGWKWNDNWTKRIYETRPYGFGHIISKEQYHYGTYEIECALPNFRGSWPAFWMVDVTGAMGIPPEVDIFEQFRKDSWLTKYKVTTTYHDGPKYMFSESKAHHSCKGYRKLHIRFEWLPTCMIWTINGKHTMTIWPSNCITFPTKPMNLLLGHGIGDWNPQDNKLAPFIVKQLTYQAF